MALPTNLPDTWGWDEHDMLVSEEDARRSQIIHEQIESLDPEALPWDPGHDHVTINATDLGGTIIEFMPEEDCGS